MRAKVVSSLIGLALISAIASGLAVSRGSRSSSVTLAKSGQGKPKTLREIAMERDVEVAGLENNSEDREYADFTELAKNAEVIVYGRIFDRTSYFDDSGLSFEHGKIIMTEYKVQVLRVLKNRIGELMLPADKAAAPLKTPLKITRNGGVVYVNGHRASMKVKGFEDINPGQDYIFFLFWSSAYKTYSLAGNISGVIAVNNDSSLRSLASSEKMNTKVHGLTLESLIRELR
jgi:hypothetical protein